MKPVSKITKENLFKLDLKNLLKKHNANLTITSNRGCYDSLVCKLTFDIKNDDYVFSSYENQITNYRCDLDIDIESEDIKVL